MWEPQQQALQAAGYRTIVPDLPGFGNSPPLPEPWSLDRLTDALVDLLDRLGLPRVAVAGMSMGGYLLLNLLDRHPQRVAAAMFVATRAAADDAAGKQRRTELAAAALAGRREEVVGGFGEALFAPRTPTERPGLVARVQGWMLEAAPRGLAAALVAMRDRPDYRPLLPRVQVPALVVGGREDRLMGPEHYQALMAGLPHARGELIDGGGHLVNLECPERCSACLCEFLDGLPTA